MNCGIWGDSWKSLNCKKIKPVNPKGSQSWIFIGATDAEAESPILWPPDGKELTHWKRPWCWERLKAGEVDDRGWDGWMASPTQCTWVWANSGRQWKTRKPSVLEFMGLQRVGCDWVTEQQQQQQNLEKPGQDRMISVWVDLSRARLDHSWPRWCPTQSHKSLGTLSCAPPPVSGCFSFNGSTYNFGGTNGKESDSQAGDARDSGLISGSGRSREEEMATRSSILAWKIPWTEEPGRL